MWITVVCESNINQGDVLSYNQNKNLWDLASTLVSPLGVAKNDAYLKQETTDVYIVEMQMQGQVLAKASRDIPQQGGDMNVENGAVYVDNNANHCGIICPNFLDSTERLTGNLVTVIVR